MRERLETTGSQPAAAIPRVMRGSGVTGVAVASSSRISAAAGAEIAADGGNAVDSAIAAMLVSLTTEPGVVAVGGGGYVTVWPSHGEPVTIDGNIEMPGRGLPPDRFGGGLREVTLAYGGGVTTMVGHGSVGTPGALAALALASSRYGRLPWARLMEPAIRWARDGFPLPQASHNYLVHAHELVYGWHPLSFAALHDDAGRLLDRGDRVHVADLADSLESIARDGIDSFYRGDIATLIAADSEANDGLLGRRDLETYEPIVRRPLRADIDRWQVATNPLPAVGGVTLAAMLGAMTPFDSFDAAAVARMIDVQRRVLGFRLARLDTATDLEPAARELLAGCRPGSGRASSSTAHASAVDDGGLGCSVTMSSGYGAGVIPPGTGIWMNNCLGELELNRRGLMVDPPGTRVSSNMAPCVARHRDGAVLSIGSPGADRITTAIFQALVHFVMRRLSLEDAIEHPRAHVEFTDAGPRAACEPGLDTSQAGIAVRTFDSLSMFFGGVGAALYRDRDGFSVAADPRRSGGTAIARAD